MGIKIKNKIVDDFNKSYDCKLTAEDIIAKTDYFNTSPQTSQKVNPLFKVRYSYAFMYALIIFLSLSVCGLFGYNQYIKKGDYCHQTVEVEPILTDEDIEYISKYAIKYSNKSSMTIVIDKMNRLYIYQGKSKDKIDDNIYFYKFDLQNTEIEYKLNDFTGQKTINDNNLIGILSHKISEKNFYDIVEFDIEINDVEYKYSLNIPR